jgi:hypothetical protein
MYLRLKFIMWLRLTPKPSGLWERLWNKLDGKREKLVRYLHHMGHVGLFITGLVPGLSMLGPVLYNLYPLNGPWYRFHNPAFWWLYLGGAVRMAGSVWFIYTNVIH